MSTRARASYATERPSRPRQRVPPARRSVARAENKPKAAPSRGVTSSAPAPTAAPSADGMYEVSPRTYFVLKRELDHMMFQIEQDLPETIDLACEGEREIVDKWRNEMGDNLKDVLGLNVTKRLLNVFNPLNVKVHFTTKPDRKYLSTFLKRYNFVAFKRLPGVVNTFAAQVKTIDDFDALCTAKSVHCGAAKITITPFYRFLQCPKKVKSVFCNPECGRGPIRRDAARKEVTSKDDSITSVKSETATKSKPDEKPKTEPIGNKPAVMNADKNLVNKTVAPKNEPPKPQRETAATKAAVAPKPTADTVPKTETPKPKVEPPQTNLAKTTPKAEPPKPKVTTPTPKVAASIVEPSTPKVATPGPKVQASTPKVATPTTKVEATTPNVATPTTKVGANTPKVATPTTKVDASTPKVATPKTKVGAFTPKVATPTTKVGACTPKVATPTAKVEASNAKVAPTPKVDTTPKPKVNETSAETSKLNPATTKPQATTPATQVVKPKVDAPKPKVEPAKAENKPPANANMTKAKPNTKSVDKAQNIAKIAAQTKSTTAKPTPAKTVAKVTPNTKAKKPFPTKAAPKKVFPNKKATKKAIEKDDFEELDDHDILALISEGIVLDECSGSDVE